MKIRRPYMSKETTLFTRKFRACNVCNGSGCIPCTQRLMCGCWAHGNIYDANDKWSLVNWSCNVIFCLISGATYSLSFILAGLLSPFLYSLILSLLKFYCKDIVHFVNAKFASQEELVIPTELSCTPNLQWLVRVNFVQHEKSEILKIPNYDERTRCNL